MVLSTGFGLVACADVYSGQAASDTQQGQQGQQSAELPESLDRVWFENKGHPRYEKVWVHLESEYAEQPIDEVLTDVCRQSFDYCLDHDHTEWNLPMQDPQAFTDDVRGQLSTECAHAMLRHNVIQGFRSPQRGSLRYFRVLGTGTYGDSDSTLACQSIRFESGLTHLEPPSVRVKCHPCSLRHVWESATVETEKYGVALGPSKEVVNWHRQEILRQWGPWSSSCERLEGPSPHDPLPLKPFGDRQR
jgi:hypothetical protein